MKLLFSHTNYPAQFRRLVPSLSEKGHEIVFLHKSREWHASEFSNFKRYHYEISRISASQMGYLHPYLGRFEDAVLEGQAAARVALRLRESGFYPDIIIAHAGFGNGLYLKDIFPKAARVGLFEWYYNSQEGSDVHFLYQLNNSDVPSDRAMRLRTWNAVTALELNQSDALVTPTIFQRDQFPPVFRDHFEVIHEGVDINTLESLRCSNISRPKCLPSDRGLKVVTHVVRGFETYRGFPQAMRALALLQQNRPDVHVLIAGADQVCYGGPETSPTGSSWGVWARNNVGLDPTRTHWLGILQTDEYHQLLAHSDAHLYMTIPFVLSWSLIEAMAAGTPLVCSDTGPVRELVTHGVEALLAPFQSIEIIARQLEDCLVDPSSASGRAKLAMSKACNYSAESGLFLWTELLSKLECQSKNSQQTLIR